MPRAMRMASQRDISGSVLAAVAETPTLPHSILWVGNVRVHPDEKRGHVVRRDADQWPTHLERFVSVNASTTKSATFSRTLVHVNESEPVTEQGSKTGEGHDRETNSTRGNAGGDAQGEWREPRLEAAGPGHAVAENNPETERTFST